MVISSSLAISLAEISAELGRQIGLLLDRNGRVEQVLVGDAHQIFIPDLGRARAGRGRLRGVRLVHTHLSNAPLSDEDYTDLVRLRLDLIAVINVSEDGRPLRLSFSHVMPDGSDQVASEPFVTTVYDESFNFTDFIAELEAEFSKNTLGVIETEGQKRALAVHVSLDAREDTGSALRELAELAHTAGVVIVEAVVQRRKQYDPKFVVGEGKLDQIIAYSLQLDCEMLIFDQDLSPNQVRALAERTELKVIDRSLLILDIFARRAQSREGKLAVELAQLKYRLPRLAHKTSAFSRLMGGVGGRGPGETQLEIDRRRARDRIHRLEGELDQVAVQRQNRRNRRQNRNVPVVALIGYTNAGKSTLFNALTESDVLVEDKLFATLDVTTRRLRFPQERELVLIDTVGFIRDLPKDLHAAFKATLEEIEDADLLLHVVDLSDPRRDEQIASVERVLAELGIADRMRLKVFNKIDLLAPQIAQNLCALHSAYGVEARNRKTTRALLNAVVLKLWQMPQVAEIASDFEPNAEPSAEPHEALFSDDTDAPSEPPPPDV